MKMHFPISLCVLLLSFLGTMEPAQALAFRCDSFLIDVGMYKIEVLKKCGNPAMSAQRVERRRLGSGQYSSNHIPPARDLHSYMHSHSHSHSHRHRSDYEQEIETQIEEWVYNFGPQRFMQLLVFENGRLSKIQELGWGQ